MDPKLIEEMLTLHARIARDTNRLRELTALAEAALPMLENQGAAR